MPSGRYGPYQLLKRIAVGGMGEVYLARREGPEGFEKLVALKRLLPALRAESEFTNMFFDEARIAAVLNHPNIAQIHDLGEIGGELLIVMEFVHGVSVREICRVASQTHGAVPVGVVCRIIADAAGALDFAHRALDANGAPLNLVHRDVSPHNIMVGFDGTVKLIDFGVAKAANKLSKTATGVVKGKIAYMSPEQASGKTLDGRSDVFGLGIVAYELLVLRRLFRRETDAATVQAVLAAEVPAPSSIEPRIPAALDAILLKALARDRDERYASAAEFKQALEALITQRRLSATRAHLAHCVTSLFPHEAKAPLNAGEPEAASAAKATPLTETAEITQTDESRAPTWTQSHPVDLRQIFESGRALEPRISTSGVVFRAIVQACEAATKGALPQLERSYGSALEFDVTRRLPTRDVSRLLEGALALLGLAGNQPNEALEAIGAVLFDALENTAQGRHLKKGRDEAAEALWPTLLELLQGMISPGERRLETVRPRFARILFKDEPLPIALYVGCFRRFLYRHGGFELQAQVETESAHRYDVVLRW